MKLESLKRVIFRHRNMRGGLFVGRMQTHDVSIPFRMLAGFPGSVNRTHPASIEPCLIDSTAPPTFYGQAVVADAAAPNGVRVPTTGDATTVIYGVTVRPFPFQQSSASNYGSASIGAGAPPTTGIVDVLKRGYIMVTLQGAAAAAKGALVHVCTVAGTGYVVGGFSADTVSGTFVTLGFQCYFNGPADASGNVEIAVNF